MFPETFILHRRRGGSPLSAVHSLSPSDTADITEGTWLRAGLRERLRSAKDAIERTGLLCRVRPGLSLLGLMSSRRGRRAVWREGGREVTIGLDSSIDVVSSSVDSMVRPFE